MWWQKDEEIDPAEEDVVTGEIDEDSDDEQQQHEQQGDGDNEKEKRKGRQTFTHSETSPLSDSLGCGPCHAHCGSPLPPQRTAKQFSLALH